MFSSVAWLAGLHSEYEQYVSLSRHLHAEYLAVTAVNLYGVVNYVTIEIGQFKMK